MSQEQFLDVIDRDEAQRRFRGAISLDPLGTEQVALDEAFERVLARDVVTTVDVPSFDRSNYDGYAVRAADTYGAQEENPRRLKLSPEVLATGVVPEVEIALGLATLIATGGMLPRGADAVVMVEYTETEGDQLIVNRAVTPGFGISYAGSDVTAGETVLRRGEVLSSRETGVLAAIGAERVTVWRKPKVAVISTGDEIIPPGQPMRPGLVYDSNARILADAVRELDGDPLVMGIVRDDLDELRSQLQAGLREADVVLLSGGTSKGAGDLSYRVVSELSEPGIVAHGVALKPGKPICLAADRGKPVVILPGFPTSAIFTFHEFVAPVIRMLGGRPAATRSNKTARLAVKVNSEIGRTEYLLVGLVGGADHLAAYPMGKGSGSVTTFARADGFVTIGRHEEIIEAGTTVNVQLIGRGHRMADLVVIGSHCVGLDFLLGKMQEQGFSTKFMAVGSTGGLEAAKRGQCDLAGMHLMDPKTGRYNEPYLTPRLKLVPGYGRLQGVVFRPGDQRFEGCRAEEAVAKVKNDADCRMVNRNAGSGTRILIDRLLDGAQPAGYAVQTQSHNAVAAAVAQGRADWGLAIEWVAKLNGLGFLPLEDERYDFVVPADRIKRPAVAAFCRLLDDQEIRRELKRMGFGGMDE
jgi:molybdopterin molybdotransferase/putative molybdopterin biosynthesis protein